MPDERTTSSLDLLVSLDRQARVPLRAQLEEQLRAAIRSGRLEQEMSLPSTRALAATLGVTRGLIVECYTQLQAEGYLTARSGAGTRVARGASGTERPGDVLEEAAPPRFDFRPASPDPGLFPRRDWAAAWREAIRHAPDVAFGYGDPRGALELRQALAGYLGRVRGVDADPRRIVICSGFTQAKNLVWRVLRARGAGPVALEDPGQPEVRRSVLRAGLTPVPIPVDELGVRVEGLDRTKADAVLVTPAHQFPTGAVLAPDRRLALRDWARESGAVIVEDDYDAELRYDREPIGALQGLGPDTVIYCGSASKAVGAGLRIGWLVCPPGWVDDITEEKRAEDHGSPILDQLTFATLVATGRFDRHLRRVRSRYRSRRDALAQSLARLAPGIALTGVAAGIQAVANLPEGAREQEIVLAAAERGVRLYGMGAYYSRPGTGPPALVMGYARLSESAVPLAIAQIADLLDPPGTGTADV